MAIATTRAFTLRSIATVQVRRPLDLLYIRSLFRPEDLGGNRYPWEVTRRLAARGHRVRVITPRPGGALPGPSAIELVTYRASRRTPFETFFTNAFASRLASAGECRRRPPEATVVSSYEVAYAHSTRRSPTPLIFIYHSHFRSDAVRALARLPGLRGAVGRIAQSFVGHVERRVLASADRIIAVSPFSVREITERVPSAKDRVRLVTTGVDTAIFSPGDRDAARSRLGLPRDARVLVIVGRLVSVKRVDRAIEAVRLLRELDQRYMLLVVGRGTEEAALRATVTSAGLEGVVHFEGYREGSELRERLAAADVQICTSEFENWSLALLEGLACGRPIVGVPAGGIPELLEGVDPRCVAGGHEGADVAAAVARLFGERGALEHIGARARTLAVERYDWERIVSQIEAVIDEVVP